MSKLITKLHQQDKTVFTTDDLRIVWQQTDTDKLKSSIHYYVTQDQLIRLSKGVYALSKDYHSWELATSLYSPSYISFQTILQSAGIIFQHYSKLFVASYLSRETEVDSHHFLYHKLKPTILTLPADVVQKTGWSEATPERAVVDMLYIDPDFYFDHTKSINWNRCLQLASMYDNKALVDRIKELHHA